MDTFLDILATWRLTILLYRERGPYGIGERFRLFTNRHPELMLMSACLWCLSMWCALPLSVGRKRWWVRVLANSAGAILLEQVRHTLDKKDS